MKTMRMPKATLFAWLAGLRSGEYAQALGTLEKKNHSGDVVGYCCLGVAQKVLDGCVELDFNGRFLDSYPTDSWWITHGIQAIDPRKEPGHVWYKDKLHGLAELNDGKKLSFLEIADLIEQSTETY